MDSIVGLHRNRLRPFFLLFCIGAIWLGLSFVISRASARTEQPVASVQAGSSTQPQYGVNFISSAENLADDLQYENGLSTGASWNRFPVYWFNIEQSEDAFNWAAQDAAIQGDVYRGLQTDAILLGTPCFYKTPVDPANCGGLQDQVSVSTRQGSLSLTTIQAATPVGLFDPIFADGTDIPGPGKAINEENKWARFVSLAVERYRPGGVLAQQQGWPAGSGVTLWEVWNEQDFTFFWDGSISDYARLLKVAYLVIEVVDPNAEVMLGGLSNINNSAAGGNVEFYNQMMAILDADSQADTYGYYHDIVATHSYFQAWNSWYHVWRAGITLADRGLEKPIWLNETGVAGWDDYPGPVWDPHSGFRATAQEQADYVIQTAFYSLFAGADAIFHFQLYDACGNQPAGTDFPPHNGELCDENGNIIGTGLPCAGDANGLFSNPTDAQCFTQHPNPESPRPNYYAYQVLTEHVTDVAPLWRLRPGGSDPANGPQEWIAFYQPGAQQRVLGVWARFGDDETAVIPTTNANGTALLITPDGASEVVQAENGNFTLNLPAATNQNAPWDDSLYAIGGRPFILIEVDDVPPLLELNGPPVAESDILLDWQAQDDGSGLDLLELWVAIDGGSAELWLSNPATAAVVYPGEPYHDYLFSLRGSDGAGNDNEVLLMVETLELPVQAYLPNISR